MPHHRSVKTGYAIFVTSLAEGAVPLVREELNRPVIFPTEHDAQREIVDGLLTRLREFQDGERDFEDATTVDEYVVRVRIRPDGTVEDEFGRRFH